LAERVEATLIAAGLASISRSYCVQRDGLDVILRARDATPSAGDELARAANGVEAALAPRVYARADGDLSALLLRRLADGGQTLVVAESCTAGLLGGRIVETPGSSRVFLGGIIAYGDELKRTLLGVSASTLDEQGAVSEATAREMAEGARVRLGADHALAITGIAGPAGGTAAKPVGSVWVAHAASITTRARGRILPGDRQQNRVWAVAMALDLLREGLGDGRLDL
jgi:nicotinamide-nucleotide amidase